MKGSHNKTVKELHEMKRKYELARLENDSLKRRILDSKLEKQRLVDAQMGGLNRLAKTGTEVASNEIPATAKTAGTLEEYFAKCPRDTKKQCHRLSL